MDGPWEQRDASLTVTKAKKVAHSFISEVLKESIKGCPEDDFLETLGQWAGKDSSVRQQGNVTGLIRAQQHDGT